MKLILITMLYKIKEPIYICGDIHGNFHWLKPYIEKYDLSDCSIVFCGDIGLGFKPLEAWYKWVHGLKLTGILRKRKIDCYFIRGNHDDPAWFNDTTLVTKHFKAVSDYSVLASPNHNILCVGGGISIDRSDRKLQMKFSYLEYLKYHPNVTVEEAKSKTVQIYWPNEAPVYNEAAIDGLTCQIDTVCSHIAPTEFPPLTGPDKCWFRVDPDLHKDCAAERGTMSNVLHRLLENQHPLQQWYYGHYHFYETGKFGGVSTNLLDMARDGALFLKELRT